MESILTNCFFFAQKIQDFENKFNAAINNLYAQIKGDEVEDHNLKEKANKVGKDLTAQLLCDILKVSILDLMDINLTFVRRQLYSYHVQQAYKLRKEQLRADIRKLKTRNGSRA